MRMRSYGFLALTALMIKSYASCPFDAKVVCLSSNLKFYCNMYYKPITLNA